MLLHTARKKRRQRPDVVFTPKILCEECGNFVSNLAGSFCLAYHIWYNEKSNELIKVSNVIVFGHFFVRYTRGKSLTFLCLRQAEW